ncbi:MAG: inositol monophosphatase family protein [Ardenticatenaceae bacterium]|nr:inositol monophosphatase family protein [Ardenticatenaceae bacterium]
MTSNAEILKVAENVALSSGKLLRRLWEEPRELTRKGFRDIVTDADFASQRLITQEIRRIFPSHGFLTEEDDETLPQEGEIIWIIDPIDGTSNYSRQMPNFSVSIGVARRQGLTLSVEVGVVYDPVRQEVFSARKGAGAKLNGHPIFSALTKNPIESVFSLDWSHGRETRQATLNILGILAHEVKTIRAIGSAALSMSWVAAGRLDGYMNINLHPWDVAAGALIVQEAGGQITNFAGDPWHWQQMDCLVSNGKLHDAYLAAIQKGLGGFTGK